MKQVECNKCGKVFEVEGEWGYCPFCENDNVEVKVGNSNGDFVDLLHLEMLELRLDLAQDKIKVLEKALELACEELNSELENPHNELYTKTSDEVIKHFKTKAKEMK